MANLWRCALTLIVSIEQHTLVSLATKSRAHILAIIREFTVPTSGASWTQAMGFSAQAINHINARSTILASMVRALLIHLTKGHSWITNALALLTIAVLTLDIPAQIILLLAVHSFVIIATFT